MLDVGCRMSKSEVGRPTLVEAVADSGDGSEMAGARGGMRMTCAGGASGSVHGLQLSPDCRDRLTHFLVVFDLLLDAVYGVQHR